MFNTDRGKQFTSAAFTGTLMRAGEVIGWPLRWRAGRSCSQHHSPSG
jgi:hypothetical protein